MDRRVFLAVGALGLLVAGGAYFLISDDEDEIRELLAEAANASSLPADRGNPAFFALGMKSRLGDVLAPGAKVHAPELGDGGAGLEELVGAAMQYGEAYRSASVRFDDVHFARLEDRAASVNATVELSAIGAAGDARRDRRTAQIEVTKIDGKWKIASVEVGPKRD
jgi:hypothetical protein